MSNQTYIPISGKLTPQTTDGVILDSFYVKDGFIVVNDSSEFNRLLQVYTDRNLTAKVYNISDNKTYLYQDGSFVEDPELVDLKNYIDDKDSSLYNYIDTESSRAQEAESELSDRIKFIEDDYLDSSDKEELQDEINLKANKSYVDNNFLNKTTDQDQLIQSNVIIAGDLTVEGTEHITDVETIESQSNLVIVNSNNIPLLAVGGAGIIARTGNQDDSAEAYAVSYYDAIKDSVVLGLGHYSDDSSIGKTFSLTEGQSIATRADSSQMVDENIPEWDAEHYTFVDSGKKVSDFVPTTRTIAGIDLQDNITKNELADALGISPDLNIGNGTASGSLSQKGATQEALVDDFSTYGSAYAYLSATNLFDAYNGPDYIKYTLNDFGDNYNDIVKYTATAYVYAGGGGTFPTTGTFEAKYAQIKQTLTTMINSGNYDEYINATIPQVEAGISQSISTDLASMGLTLSPNVIEKTATLSTVLGNNNKIYAPVSFANGYGNIVGNKGWPQATIGAIASGWNMKAWGNGAMAVGKKSSFSPSNFSGQIRIIARLYIKHLQEIYNEAGDPYWKSTLPVEIATASTDVDYDAITVEMGEAHGDNAVALGGSSTFDVNSLVAGNFNFNTGINAAVFNNQNVNTGANAIVGGLLNINKSNCSLTVGVGNRNAHHNSFIAGENNVARSYCGVTVGSGLLNNADYKAVFGTYNIDKSDTRFEIGNGTAENVRSNAFEVTESGIARAYGAPVGDNDLTPKSYVDAADMLKVDKTVTIAGIDLQDNITKSELLLALNVADGAQVNVLEGVKDSNGNDLTITNKKVQLSKSAVGLSNVVNTGDSATPVSGGTTKFTTGGAFIELAKKVDKTTTVAGIALSGNISAQSLTDALIYMNTTTDLDYVMGE